MVNTDTVTWRKVDGRWVVYGHASQVSAQADVHVTLNLDPPVIMGGGCGGT